MPFLEGFAMAPLPNVVTQNPMVRVLTDPVTLDALATRVNELMLGYA